MTTGSLKVLINFCLVAVVLLYFFWCCVFCKDVLLTICGLILYFLPPLVCMTVAVGPLMLQSFLLNARNLLYLQYSRYCTEVEIFFVVPEVLHQALNNYITYCTVKNQILGSKIVVWSVLKGCQHLVLMC